MKRITDRDTLYKVARSIGMTTPVNPNFVNWDLYAHYELYCAMQLNADMPYDGAHIDNAKLIKRLSMAEAESISRGQLMKMGFVIGNSEA